MNLNLVNEYIQQSKSIIDASPQMDEENTKAKLIQPFIHLLGWDIYSPEVKLEHPIQMGRNRTRVDYALLIGDEPVVLIEAKPLKSSISDSDADQLRSYMRQELKIDWGIVTNGESFEVLNKSTSDRTGEEVSLMKFELGDLDNNPHIIDILTKESIKSGKSDEIAQQVAQATEAIEQLSGEKAQTARKLVEVIQNELDQPMPIDIEEQALEFINTLIHALEEQKSVIRSDIMDVSLEKSQPRTDDETGQQEDNLGSHEPVSVDAYQIDIVDDKEVRFAFTDKNQSNVMAEFVNHLISEYSLISEIEPLPYVPGRRKTAIINTHPTHPDGQGPMRTFREVDNGLYLNTHTHMGKKTKRREIERLADKCGIEVAFRGNW